MDVDRLPDDEYSRTLSGLLNNPASISSNSSTTIDLLTYLGHSESWIVKTVRVDGHDTVFLRRINARGGESLIIPPAVAAAIARQSARLDDMARARAARRGFETRKAKGTQKAPPRRQSGRGSPMIININPRIWKALQAQIEERPVKPLLVDLVHFYATGKLSQARDIIRGAADGFLSGDQRSQARELIPPLNEILSPRARATSPPELGSSPVDRRTDGRPPSPSPAAGERLELCALLEEWLEAGDGQYYAGSDLIARTRRALERGE